MIQCLRIKRDGKNVPRFRETQKNKWSSERGNELRM